MCGIVGYVGPVPWRLLVNTVEESKVRGLHHLGSRLLKDAGVYHTRYCTSGLANQPITLEGTSIVMNGVIHMGTQKEMEQYFNISLTTDNDAEVLLRFFLKGVSFEKFCKQFPQVSVAALVINKKGLQAFTNGKRPLWMIVKGGYTLLASTQDILRRAGADWRAAKSLEPNKTYTWWTI